MQCDDVAKNMHNLRFCTLTGVDESTSLPRLSRLSRSFPIAEWGVLFSRSKMKSEEGQGRYPRVEWIRRFTDHAKKHNLRTALHVCGADVEALLKGDPELVSLASGFQRIQMNFTAERELIGGHLPAHCVIDFIREHELQSRAGRVIIQYNSNNAEFCRGLSGGAGIDYLVDASGGRGLVPKEWPDQNQLFGMRCGYAGGLGPDNVIAELDRIQKSAAGKSFWIDMESKLRVDDRFDLARCETVLKKVSLHLIQVSIEQGRRIELSGECPTDPQALDGFWLNWWAGVSCGYAMVIPPANACRPVNFDRRTGALDGFEPTESMGDLRDALDGCDVGCLKVGDTWDGVTTDGQRIVGDTREQAMLRALVLERIGPVLSANPAHSVEVQRHWVGEPVVSKMLASAIKSSSTKPSNTTLFAGVASKPKAKPSLPDSPNVASPMTQKPKPKGFPK